jgi:hypothetical protein
MALTWRTIVALFLATLANCSAVKPAAPSIQRALIDHPLMVYVVRRKWHVDVGFAVADVEAGLAPIAAQFPTAKYLFFGFGDRHYLMTKDKGTPLILGALWPGPALLLVTAIDGTPPQAFGTSEVIRIGLNTDEVRAMQAFMRSSIAESDLSPFAPGPYAQSAYYPAVQQYSLLHTCNTWVAEALRAARQPVHSKGVILAGQLWRQVTRLAEPALPVPAAQ